MISIHSGDKGEKRTHGRTYRRTETTWLRCFRGRMGTKYRQAQ